MALTERLSIGALLGALLACGAERGPAASNMPNGGEGGEGGSGGNAAAAGAAAGDSSDEPADPDPMITAEAMSALSALAYDPSPPLADPSNRVVDDENARLLGQRLFFETSLSGRLLDRDNDGGSATLGQFGEAGRVSCAGCHMPEAGFVDARSPHRQISLAAQWTRRRSPTLLEVASLPAFNWDGRRDTLWNQALGVIESSVEFNSGRLFVAQQVFKTYRESYEQVFGPLPPLDDPTRFPPLTALEAGCDAGPVETAPCRGKPGDKADYDGMATEDQEAVTRVAVNVGKALAAYLTQLRCGPSRFDEWLAGDETALTRSEQRGAALFVGAGKCVSCHSGPNFTDGKFHNVGLRPEVVAVAFTDSGDRGAAEGLRLSIDDPLNSKGAFSDGDRGTLPESLGPELEGAFRTPTLRCISTQPSFMHTAQIRTLAQVVQFFNRGGDPAGYPGTNEIMPLGLSELEQADLVAFVSALQGEGPDPALLAPPQ